MRDHLGKIMRDCLPGDACRWRSDPAARGSGSSIKAKCSRMTPGGNGRGARVGRAAGGSEKREPHPGRWAEPGGGEGVGGRQTSTFSRSIVLV